MQVGNYKYLVFIIGAISFACNAIATELYGPEAGTVPYGMGRAYSAIADDWLALYYNPAGLALVKKAEFKLFDAQLGVSKDTINSYKTLKNFSNKSKTVAQTASGYVGKNVGASMSDYTQLTLPKLAFAVSYNLNAAMNIQNTANPQTYIRYTKDVGLHMGFGVGMGPKNDLRIGAKISNVHRTGGTRLLQTYELTSAKGGITSQFADNGGGIAADIGMQARLPTGTRTEYTASFVWHDMGDTSFGSAADGNRPTRIEQNLVAGFGVRVPIGGKKNRRLERRYGPDRSSSALSFAFDYSYLNIGTSKEELAKHLHYGMNLDLPLVSLQLGVNQNFLTMGGGFDIGLLHVNAVTYAEEKGSYVGQNTDRRYLVSVGGNFSFAGF